MARHHKLALIFGIGLALLVLFIGIDGSSPISQTPPPPPSQIIPAASTIPPTEANLKVAFIGDSAYGTNFDNVLNLIKNEGADIVLHQGDFDYVYDADGFFAKVDSILGSTFPYFISVGNHDAASWPTGCGDPDGCYAQFSLDRLSALSITPDDPDLNDQKYSIVYKGLKMVFVGENGDNANFASFINTQLSGDNHIWKICSWHKNQQAMQVGGKNNEMGWSVYENCRSNGAIIATAHEHSYSRTKTLTSMSNQTVDSTCSDPSFLCVDPGRTFAFVSGLGGHSIRSQTRCLPSTYPYGCNGEWGSIYTSTQGATYGALFIEFYVDGNSKKARGYFKNVSGTIIDGPFEAWVGYTPPAPPPPPPPPPPPAPPPAPQPSPQPSPPPEESPPPQEPPPSEPPPEPPSSFPPSEPTMEEPKELLTPPPILDPEAFSWKVLGIGIGIMLMALLAFLFL